jgi:hypothetical protein
MNQPESSTDISWSIPTIEANLLCLNVTKNVIVKWIRLVCMRVSPVAAYGIWGMMDLKLCRWFLILEALQTIGS